MIKILLAEDKTPVSYAISSLLEKLSDFKFILVSNGEQAVNTVLKDDNNEIDIVLMDIRMPGMNGIEAIELIKELRPSLPIIAVTAFGDKTTREKAKEAGCDDFFVKPVVRDKYNRLAIKIKRLVNPARIDAQKEVLLVSLSRRLQRLREREAKLGLETPVSILNEIDDIEQRIENLQS